MSASVHMTWPQYLRNECTLRVDGVDEVIQLSKIQRELVFLLLVSRPYALPVHHIIAFLWPSVEPEWAESCVQVHMWRLRQKLRRSVSILSRGRSYRRRMGNSELVADPGGYRLEDVP